MRKQDRSTHHPDLRPHKDNLRLAREKRHPQICLPLLGAGVEVGLPEGVDGVHATHRFWMVLEGLPKGFGEGGIGYVWVG